MPRPAPEGGARLLLLNFRANDDEAEVIDAAADAKGQTRSEWLRGVALRAARRAANQPPAAKEK